MRGDQMVHWRDDHRRRPPSGDRARPLPGDARPDRLGGVPATQPAARGGAGECRQLGLLILIGAAAVLIGMSLGIKDGSSGSEAVAPAGPTFGVGEVVLLTGGVLLLATLVGAVFLSAWFRRAWYRALAGPVELTADVDGATVRRTGQETRFTWASVLAWSEDAGRLYVSIAPNVGWPLPKGDFRSHEEVDRIRMVLADSGAPKR